MAALEPAVTTLRVSITTDCDLRCLYCRTPEARSGGGAPMLDPQQVAAVCAALRDEFGLARIRLTGGEPLLRADAVDWVRALAGTGVEVAMTTNGQRMAEFARRLRDAGLERVNFSLDALDPAIFRRLTGGDVAETLRGIEAARDAGFRKLKTNTVVLRGWNEGEVAGVAEFALARQIEPRFLELMGIGVARVRHAEWFVDVHEMLSLLSAALELRPVGREAGATSSLWEAWRDGRRMGTIGVISPESEPFCGDCRRLRLSAQGRLFGCLMSEEGVDVMPCFDGRGRLDRRQLAECVRRALAAKPGIRAERRRSPVVGIGG